MNQKHPNYPNVSLSLNLLRRQAHDHTSAAFRDTCLPNTFADSQRHIKHLTATEISHRVLQDSWRGNPVIPLMTHLMQGLTEFRLGFSCHEDEIDPAEIDVEADIEEHHEKGLLAQWLGLAHEIRVIKIMAYSVDLDRPNARLERSLGRTTWPKLRELGLSHFSTTENELVDLLLRHAKSLRRLSLSFIYLTEGSWESVLMRIGGKLPKLKKVKLRGFFRCGVHSFDLGDPESSDGAAGFRDGIEQ